MTSSDRKAKVPERDTACYSRAIFDDSNLRQRNQENEADEMAVALTDTPNLTSSHSLAIQLGSIKDGKKHWGGNSSSSSSSTDFFCLDVFGKATAVHRIGWRAGIHGQAQDTPRKQRKEYSPSAKGHGGVCFSFLFWKSQARNGQVHVTVSNIPTRDIRETGRVLSGYRHLLRT